MPLHRFRALYRYFKIFPLELEREKPHTKKRAPHQLPLVYRQVAEWSGILQEATLRYYIPSLNVTVDEGMVRFTGKSFEKTTIPTKPIPMGFRVWIVAQGGICLRWLWHTCGFGPRAFSHRGTSS